MQYTTEISCCYTDEDTKLSSLNNQSFQVGSLALPTRVELITTEIDGSLMPHDENGNALDVSVHPLSCAHPTFNFKHRDVCLADFY